MVVFNWVHVAVSCGTVLFYSFVWSIMGSLVTSNHAARDEEREAEAQEDEAREALSSGADMPLARADPSLDALDLFPRFGQPYRLSDAGPVTNTASSSEGSDGGESFADVLEGLEYCFPDPCSNRLSKRTSRMPLALIHSATLPEIEPGDHKSTSTERRSSTVFCPENQKQNEEEVGRVGALFEKESPTEISTVRAKNAKKTILGFRRSPSVSARLTKAKPETRASPVTERKRRLFSPSLGALRRASQPMSLLPGAAEQHKADAPRIDYMSAVRTRFRILNAKRSALKLGAAADTPGMAEPVDAANGRRIRSELYTRLTH